MQEAGELHLACGQVPVRYAAGGEVHGDVRLDMDDPFLKWLHDTFGEWNEQQMGTQ